MPDSATQTTEQQQHTRKRVQGREDDDDKYDKDDDEDDEDGQRRHAASTRACRAARARLYYRLLRPHRHWGVVPEPYMSPLHAVNLLMCHFGKRTVTVAEAAAAVRDVTEYYTNLAQSAPHTARQAAAGGRRRGTTTAAAATAATAAASPQPSNNNGSSSSSSSTRPTSSLQQQPPHSVVDVHAGGHVPHTQRRGLTQESVLALSQVSLTQQTTCTLTTNIQDALVLDVLQRLCAARRLRLSRLSSRQLRHVGNHLGAADVAPHRRALVVADRRDPLFTLICGVASHATREPLQHSDEDEDESDGSKKKKMRSCRRGKRGKGAAASSSCSAATRPPYMQLICTASMPVPWRRLVRTRLAYFPPKECVVAVVERDDDDDEDDDDDDEEQQQRQHDASATAASSTTATRPRCGKRVRSPSPQSAAALTSTHEQQQQQTQPQLLLPLSSSRSPSQQQQQQRMRSKAGDDNNKVDTRQEHGCRSRSKSNESDEADGAVTADTTTASLLSLLPRSRAKGTVAAAAAVIDDVSAASLPRHILAAVTDTTATGVSSAQPLFGAADALADDPLLRIPRVDVGGRGDVRRQRRSWLERMFLIHTCDRAVAYGRLYDAATNATAAAAQQQQRQQCPRGRGVG